MYVNLNNFKRGKAAENGSGIEIILVIVLYGKRLKLIHSDVLDLLLSNFKCTRMSYYLK